MKKIIVLIFMLFSFIIFANSGKNGKETVIVKSFEIIVVDADTDEPIPAVQIKISQNDLEAYTDFDGLAKFKNLSSGIYDIEISFISYQKFHLKSYKLDRTNSQVVVKLRS